MSYHLQWLESMHTLHGSVEILYVVDGYQIQRKFDDSEVGEPIKAETLEDCIDTAIASGWKPLTMKDVKPNY
ncbi:hypothetical protein KGB42_gp65 [Salmonella phage Seszw_1]|uniref:Uncharacterized protein n=1 Tax=Salmonella phage Seszw_1 TaxID=2479482 RepID=A0A411BF63_9CAUD|nr:hypothetical protein KGB42_gp65 [Salmonella phage Seszw_1]QZB85785.1 hypothetical protein seszw10L_71 [Salmonella phage seszw]QAY00275.1 hypothetical protein Seszw_65 [Salmonella phage Seszw_1]QZB85866.1 hypothetical protein seszw10S_71 [Salmonella phage seszw]QZB85945.1 hypothetical protein seszw20L_71 [Salmonella phage seszw]QZB86025.1 hypothetical protein seszw20S_71 [Salmonella phage seszw]